MINPKEIEKQVKDRYPGQKHKGIIERAVREVMEKEKKNND